MGLGTGLNLGLPRFKRIREAVVDGLVMFNRFTSQGKPNSISHPAQGSAEFDGSSYITMGEKHVANDLGITDAFTFGAWAYVLNAGSYKSIVTMWNNSGSTIFWFGFDTSEQFHYNISLTGGDKSRNIQSIPIEEWHYVNLTYDGASLKLYLNGSNVDTVVATGTVDGRGAALTESLLIGAQNNGLTAFQNGNLANVAIWNRALTSDEINSVMWKKYDSLTTDEKDGLQAWYKLQATEVFDATDTSTANLEKYQGLNTLTFERKTALQTALAALPDQGRDRLLFEAYKTRVTTAGGTVEARNNTINEINELL